MYRHRARPVVIIGLILCAPAAVKGQQCAPPASPAFEFQVDAPESRESFSTLRPSRADYRGRSRISPY